MDFTIVYMVAGLSSRFRGRIKAFTEVGPKNETLIEYSISQAINAGFNKIIFIVSEQTEEPFKKKFGDSYKGVPVFYALQKYDSEKRDKPWGTCDAVCSAIDLIKEPFVVATGDDIYGKKTFEILINHLKKQEDDATAVTRLIEMLPEDNQTVNRGTFKVDENNYVIKSEETIGISRENFRDKGFQENSPVNISIFGLNPETLKFLKEKLEEFKEKNKNDRRAECYLNIKISELIREGKIKMKLYYTPEKWLGVTNPGDEIKVRKELKI
ncbi:MAG: NTP transferase domain-containing protein [Nanoarchaeota archaeon]|nr:NTP transferase domain-containing protein [Nanoarchaeota archaeon]